MKFQKECDKEMQIKGQSKNPRCLLCGRPTRVMHHLIEKSISAVLRYDWDNLIPLCNMCHTLVHQSGDPTYEFEIIKKRGGNEWYENLRQRGRQIIKVNIEYYKTQLQKLQNM